MRDIIAIASISLLIFSLVLLAERYNLFEFVELKTLDKRHNLYAPSRTAPSDDIVLVAIDSKSQSLLEPLPWPQDIYLALYAALREVKPKAVGLMVWFNREERSEIEIEPDNNLFVVQPYTLPPVVDRDSIPTVSSWYSIPSKFEAARGKSYSYMTFSPEDGIYRSAQMVVRDGSTGRFVFPIELLMAGHFWGVDEGSIRFERNRWIGGRIKIGSVAVPVDSGGRFYLSFLPPGRSFKTISFVDVLELYQEGNLRQLERIFKGKIVLVGETEGAYRVPTPAGEMTALEMRANLVNDLLTRAFITRLSSTVNLIYLIVLLLLSLALTFLIYRFDSRVSLLGTGYGALLLLHLALAFFLFQNWGIWLEMVTPGVMLSLNGVSSALFLSYVNLRRTQKQLIQSEKEAAFGMMSAQVRHEIRNILNSIRAPAEMIRNNFLKGDPLGLKEKPEEIVSEMELIIERTMKLNEMIENELSFFQEASLRTQPVELGELIRSALEICKEEIDKNGVETFVEVDPSLPLISADKDKLRIAFVNLIRNACQATSGMAAVTFPSSPDRISFPLTSSARSFRSDGTISLSSSTAF